jgi:hypothetical protein
MLNILVACKEERTPGGLEYAPAHRVLYDTTPGWSVASNALLARAQALGGDALFLDDDTTLTQGCLDAVYAYYDSASLFGLDLHDMNGERQAGARHVLNKDGLLQDWISPGPAYVAHVSTSAIYIKEEALSLRFPVWDGIHWEDVAFCLESWLQGMRVLAVPGYVQHAIVAGVGSTKRHDPDFWARWAKNMGCLGEWMGEKGVMQAIAEGKVPVGVQPLEDWKEGWTHATTTH